MILNLNLPLRRRIKYFNLLTRARQLVRENIYLTLFFFVELYLKTFGLEIKEIHLKQYDGEVKTDYEENDLNLQSKKNAYREFKKKIKISNDDLVLENDTIIENTAIARELTNLSEVSYKRFRLKIKSFVQIPPLYKINIFKKKLNQFFKIYTNRYGVYVDSKFKIEFTLKKIYNNFINGNINMDERVFRIHLCGDGCQITKTKIKIIKFTFRVINEFNNSVFSIYHLGKMNISNLRLLNLKIIILKN